MVASGVSADNRHVEPVMRGRPQLDANHVYLQGLANHMQQLAIPAPNIQDAADGRRMSS